MLEAAGLIPAAFFYGRNNIRIDLEIFSARMVPGPAFGLVRFI